LSTGTYTHSTPVVDAGKYPCTNVRHLPPGVCPSDVTVITITQTLITLTITLNINPIILNPNSNQGADVWGVKCLVMPSICCC